MTLPYAPIALLLAIGTGVAWPHLLSRLPEPEADDPPGYARLATIRHALAVALVVLALNAWALPRVAAELAPTWAVLGSVGVVAGAVDAWTRWMPRRLLHLAWAGGLVTVLGATLAGTDVGLLLRGSLGFVMSGAVMALVWWGARGGLGFSDVRLAALTGGVTAATSVGHAVRALVLGTLVGACWGLALRLARGRDGPFPYGPSLLAGAYLSLAVPT